MARTSTHTNPNSGNTAQSRSGTPTGDTAIPRGSMDPQNPYNGADFRDSNQLAQWIQWEHDHNPNYRMPENGAFYLDENGQVHPKRDADNFLMKHPWVIPLLGVGAGFGIAAASGGFGAGAGLADAGSASVNGGVGVGSGASTAGLGGGLAGAGDFSTIGAPSGAAGNVAAAGGSLSTAAKISAAMRAAGLATDAATSAAARNRETDQNFDLRSQDEFEREQMDFADREARERQQAMKDAYRDSWYQNRQPGPFNSRGLTPVSADFQQTLDQAGQQARDMLAQKAKYSTGNLQPPTRVPRAKKSTGESIGQWAGPTLEGLGALMSLFGK